MSQGNYRHCFPLVSLFMLCMGVTAAMGQLGSRETKEWIDRLEQPDRIAGLKVSEIVSRLGLKPGMVIADIGAGTGIFSRPFAKGVAPSGKVYSVDIDKGLLEYINQRAKQENISNIRTVAGKFDDPAIPGKDVDMAFFHDVFHHIEHRQAYLKTLSNYIKPNGMIAMVEMDKNDPKTPHKDQPEMLVSRADVDKWMAEAGFRPMKEFPELFPGTKWFVIYQKSAQQTSRRGY